MAQDIERHDLTQKLQAKNRARRKATLASYSPEIYSTKTRNDVLPNLKLEEIVIADISDKGRKIRKLEQTHILEIMRSIQSLGFCSPILIGSGNGLIDGVSRVEAARRLGLDKLPCIHIGHLSNEEQRLLRLSINRLAEKGEWDLAELKLEFEELVIHGLSIETTGFSLDQIDHVMLDNEVGETELGPISPEVGNEPKAVVGDIYQLGPHRVICGDSTDPNVIKALINQVPEASVRMVLTDVPYNVPIAGHVTQGNHPEFAMASGEMSDPEFQNFNRKWMGTCLPYVMDGGLLATFIDWRGLEHVHAAATSLGLDQLNLIVWSKTNGGMGSLYRSQHELFPIYKKGLETHVNNINLGKRGRYRTNVWTYPGASSLSSDARKGLEFHPTVKPSAMLEDALLDVTERGDLVIDPFLGSGSTLIAAHQTGRICYGVELDRHYVDLIVSRYEQLTGQKAVLINPAQTQSTP
jgi:DNA modification methylase